MKTFRAPIAVAVVVAVLCSVPPSSADRREATAVAAAAAAADLGTVDPSLDVLADNVEDRSKRQLSFVQSRLLNFLKPLPVVDVMKEEEKYGNDGDKFNRIGRSFIGGVEKVSSMLTSALSLPVDSAKKLSRSATEMLNKLGGRLVGLQR